METNSMNVASKVRLHCEQECDCYVWLDNIRLAIKTPKRGVICYDSSNKPADKISKKCGSNRPHPTTRGAMTPCDPLSSPRSPFKPDRAGHSQSQPSIDGSSWRCSSLRRICYAAASFREIAMQPKPFWGLGLGSRPITDARLA